MKTSIPMEAAMPNDDVKKLLLELEANTKRIAARFGLKVHEEAKSTEPVSTEKETKIWGI